jgi:hypothetical protein
MNALFALVALLVVAAQAPMRKGPEPPPVGSGTSSIAGRVTDSADKPVEGAEVVITEKPLAGQRPVMRSSKTLTDRDGSYEFRNIGANTYMLFVSHSRHLIGCFPLVGQCSDIELLTEQSRADVNVQLRPAGSVKGRLTDHEGQPVADMIVNTWLAENHSMGGMPGRSDADGRFELTKLQPGTVVIAAEVMGRGAQGYSRVYYPGVLNASEAQPFTIEPGGTIEMEMRIPEITSASIAAHISGPDGYRVERVMLLRPETKSRLPVSLQENVATVINLRQGRYAVEARGAVRGDPHVAFAFIDLQSIDIEIPLTLEPAGSVNGKIIAERGGLPPVDGVRIAAAWTSDGVDVEPSNSDELPVGPDGAFRFTGLFGHRDFRVIGLPDDWQVTAIRAGRSDITTSGLDIESGSNTELTIVVVRR